MAEQLKLPPSVTSPTIKDENGRCWSLKGFTTNSDGIVHISEDIKIDDNIPCCVNCDIFSTLEIISPEDIPDIFPLIV